MRREETALGTIRVSSLSIGFLYSFNQLSLPMTTKTSFMVLFQSSFKVSRLTQRISQLHLIPSKITLLVVLQALAARHAHVFIFFISPNTTHVRYSYANRFNFKVWG